MLIAFITKWAETHTIEISEENLKTQKDPCSHDPYVSDGWLRARINGMWLSFSPKDWTLEYEEAERRWEAKRKRDITSLRKRIAKLEAALFTCVSLDNDERRIGQFAVENEGRTVGSIPWHLWQSKS